MILQKKMWNPNSLPDLYKIDFGENGAYSMNLRTLGRDISGLGRCNLDPH